jgi:small nuclear ribonucleoprotein (snRNP)-like protein
MPDKRPFDLLNEMLNKQIVVVIKGDKTFRGKLLSYDIHMNLEMQGVQQEGSDKQISKMLIRGDSIVLLYLE